MMDAEKAFFQKMEDGIAKLNSEQREQIYSECAKNCVCGSVLKEQRRIFEECHGDMDLIYSKKYDNEYCFHKIIKKGHIYEMGYPRCLCYMYESGFATSANHCECSRQSIIYILKELSPEKRFKVEQIHTVLDGSKDCVFRITVE